jgi:hypothetical protein
MRFEARLLTAVFATLVLSGCDKPKQWCEDARREALVVAEDGIKAAMLLGPGEPSCDGIDALLEVRARHAWADRKISWLCWRKASPDGAAEWNSFAARYRARFEWCEMRRKNAIRK